MLVKLRHINYLLGLVKNNEKKYFMWIPHTKKKFFLERVSVVRKDDYLVISFNVGDDADVNLWNSDCYHISHNDKILSFIGEKIKHDGNIISFKVIDYIIEEQRENSRNYLFKKNFKVLINVELENQWTEFTFKVHDISQHGISFVAPQGKIKNFFKADFEGFRKIKIVGINDERFIVPAPLKIVHSGPFDDLPLDGLFKVGAHIPAGISTNFV